MVDLRSFKIRLNLLHYLQENFLIFVKIEISKKIMWLIQKEEE